MGNCKCKILASEAQGEDIASAAFVHQFLVVSCIGFCEGGNESASLIKHEITLATASVTPSFAGERI